MAEIKIAPVSARYLGGQRAEILSNQRAFAVGQRVDDGPPGEKFCPIEMVVAGFAAWMVLTMSAVAENKGIPVEKIDVQVTPHIVEERGSMSTRLETRIDIGAGLGKRERVILFNSARRCEVHKLLSGTFEFDFDLVAED